MRTESIQLELPLDYTVKQLYPILHDVIRCPYELIDQILRKVDKYAARKVFYKILGKDHLKDVETLEYVIRYDEIYASAKNASKRGLELQEELRKEFQETSFKVSQQFAALVLKVKINAGNTFVSPFEYVSYDHGQFEIKLSRAFKMYLHILRLKEYASIVPFAKGDERLLVSFSVHHTDKFYWVIRRHQWAKGVVTYDLEDLKENMGCQEMTNKSFFALLSKIEDDLRDTWSEFKHRKVKKGKFVKEIEIKFNSDNLNREKNRLDMRFEYEEELRQNGVDIDTIYNIRKLIAIGGTIEKNGKQYPWTPFYVLQTIRMAKHQQRVINVHRNESKSKRDIGNFRGYLIKALFEGYWAEKIEEIKIEEFNHKLFGNQVKRGISVTAKAIPEEEFMIMAFENDLSIEEYKTMLNKQGKFYMEYMDYQSGKVYWVPVDHVKRLKTLQTKEAIKSIKYKKAS